MEFSWSAIQSVENLERSRASRFQQEWRPLLFGYFGLTPGMRVLEVGCGPGTLAPYLAIGLNPGTVTAVDLDKKFIQHAADKAVREGHTGVRYLVANAYHLPFEDGLFDAAVSYTGIGILTQPRQAIREMVRVVRPGGSIAVAEAVSGPNGIFFKGIDSLAKNESYPRASRYWALRERLYQALGGDSKLLELGDPDWPPSALWGLMAQEGIINLRINAWGYVVADDDSRHKNRSERIRDHGAKEQELIQSLQADPQWKHVLQGNEWEELIRLIEDRQNWLANHAAFDWEAGLSIVMTGNQGL